MKNKIFLKLKENRWVTNMLPILCLIVLCIVFSILTKGRFTTSINLGTVINQSLVVGVIAIGASCVFATGNVNIAMGSCTALTATLAAMVYMKTESVPLMFIVAVVIGVAIMVICAMLSTIFRVPVMFVTIVMMVLLVAIQQELLAGSNISLPYEMTNGLQKLYIPYVIFVLFLIFSIGLFHFTEIGRSMKMIGANPHCAYLTGISKNRSLMIAFIVAGIGVGLGAILTIIRTGSITVYTNATTNMDVMLAIVLGGMSVYGGSKSKVYAGAIGALTVTVLNNGLLMIGVSSTVLQGVRGVVFLFLVLLGNKRSVLLPGGR